MTDRAAVQCTRCMTRPVNAGVVSSLPRPDAPDQEETLCGRCWATLLASVSDVSRRDAWCFVLRALGKGDDAVASHVGVPAHRVRTACERVSDAAGPETATMAVVRRLPSRRVTGESKVGAQ